MTLRKNNKSFVRNNIRSGSSNERCFVNSQLLSEASVMYSLVTETYMQQERFSPPYIARVVYFSELV